MVTLLINFYFPVIFEDSIRAQMILRTWDPKEHKKLGRQVQNFDKVTWGRKSVEVVKKGSEYKVFYYIPITNTTLELSVFWLSDT